MTLIAAALLRITAAEAAEPVTLGAAEAHRMAARGEVLLVDIRSPREWKETGVGTTATPISMHQPGFYDMLNKAIGGNRMRAVAVICDRGARSSFIAGRLVRLGYTRVYNVAEGMLGGRYGDGWISSGLPVKPYR